MDRFIRRRTVEDRTGLSRSTIYQMMQEGRFPKAVRLSARAVAWPEAEINDWLNARLSERGEATR
jgi:prophage regulatory protein